VTVESDNQSSAGSYPGVASSKPEGGQPGVLSAAPNQPRPGVAGLVPPAPAPGVAAARPTPSTLPFAGQTGPGMLAGVLGGLGLASLGAALHLRTRRKAAEQELSGGGQPPVGEMSELPLDEDHHE
jgi:hypothetical protein